MKKILLVLLTLGAASQLYAQNLEISIGANTGLFHYAGNGSTATSFIHGTQANAENRTDNPYGSNNGLSYGVHVQLQYVAKSGFIIGSQFGGDLLRSKVNITGIAPYGVFFLNVLVPGPFMEYPSPATGTTYLRDYTLDVSPYIGYRVKAGKVKLDLMPGIDLGFATSSYDEGVAKLTDYTGTGQSVYRTDYGLSKPATDVRLKFGVGAGHGNWGLNLSYAHGLTKYVPDLYTPTTSVYVHTELVRMGISYRIQ